MVDLGQKRWKRFHLFYWNKFYNIVSTKTKLLMKQFAKTAFIIFLSLFLFNCSGAKTKKASDSTSVENQSNNGNTKVSENETKNSSAKNKSIKDGSSIKNAIKVNSIPEEYQIARKLCPNCKINGQALINEGNKHYDVLNLTNEKGEEIKYYFDINSFFGKW